MLVEIPDPEIILGIVISFFVGLFALYVIYKIKPSTKQQERFDVSSYDRLEYYERQLIDMKIRLDSMEIDIEGGNPAEIKELRPNVERTPKYEKYSEPKPKRVAPKPQPAPTSDYHNTVDFILGLITDKSMTSRDIQNASHRSREHTSRLMKKLYSDGYVERNTRTKPYTYSITDKGKAKIGIMEYLQETAA
jgi:predicted transcriptional regulator